MRKIRKERGIIEFSTTRIPSLKAMADNTSNGWNCEQLSDDEVAKSLHYNMIAHCIMTVNRPEFTEFRNKIRWNKSFVLHQAASKDLYNLLLAEFNKRGLSDKYCFDFDINVT